MDQQNRVNINDYLLILRDIVKIDPILKLYEKRGENETFLDKTNNIKRIIETAKRYFFDYLEISKSVYPRITMLDIGYDVFWEFFDYIIKMSEDFYIEYNMGGETQNLYQLRLDLNDTLESYKVKLWNCKSELEEKIIKRRIWLV